VEFLLIKAGLQGLFDILPQPLFHKKYFLCLNDTPVGDHGSCQPGSLSWFLGSFHVAVEDLENKPGQIVK
jgi:hypothetical protein